MNRTVWVVILVISLSLMSAGIHYGGYGRSDDISNIPCLGCLGLNPVFQTDFRFDARAPHPEFVTGTLEQEVVFLHYITNVCSACDEMKPVIDEIEREFPQVRFIHINLDMDTGDLRDSYFVYDTEGSGDAITGVPMFVIMTKNREGDEYRPYFKTLYGIHPKENLVSDLQHAIGLYPGSRVFTPMVDLFVDEPCSHCPQAEHALLELYEEGTAYFVSYVTDAQGVSGSYSRELEGRYQERYGGIGHPRAEFNGGEERLIGGPQDVKDQYTDLLDQLNRTPVPVDISLEMEESNSGYRIGYRVDSRATGTYGFRVILADRYSPWNNRYGEYIPMAFVDNVFDTTLELDDGMVREDSTLWNGTDAFSADRFSALCLFGILTTEDDRIVGTAHLAPGDDGISLESVDDKTAISPLESKYMGFRVFNDMDEFITMNVTVRDDLGWDISHMELIGVEAGESLTFYITVNCPVDASLGDKNTLEVTCEVAGMEYLYRRARVELEVKEDSVKPFISDVRLTPREPSCGDEVRIDVLVTDNQGVERVEIMYYVCTDVMCAPTVTQVMERDGIGYSVTVGPFEEHFTDLHLTIIAEDINGNVNETPMYEFGLHAHEEETSLSIIPLFIALTVATLILLPRKMKKR